MFMGNKHALIKTVVFLCRFWRTVLERWQDWHADELLESIAAKAWGSWGRGKDEKEVTGCHRQKLLSSAWEKFSARENVKHCHGINCVYAKSSEKWWTEEFAYGTRESNRKISWWKMNGLTHDARGAHYHPQQISFLFFFWIGACTSQIPSDPILWDKTGDKKSKGTGGIKGGWPLTSHSYANRGSRGQGLNPKGVPGGSHVPETSADFIGNRLFFVVCVTGWPSSSFTFIHRSRTIKLG